MRSESVEVFNDFLLYTFYLTTDKVKNDFERSKNLGPISQNCLFCKISKWFLYLLLAVMINHLIAPLFFSFTYTGCAKTAAFNVAKKSDRLSLYAKFSN